MSCEDDAGVMFLQGKECRRLSATHQKLGEKHGADSHLQPPGEPDSANAFTSDFQPSGDFLESALTGRTLFTGPQGSTAPAATRCQQSFILGVRGRAARAAQDLIGGKRRRRGGAQSESGSSCSGAVAGTSPERPPSTEAAVLSWRDQPSERWPRLLLVWSQRPVARARIRSAETRLPPACRPCEGGAELGGLERRRPGARRARAESEADERLVAAAPGDSAREPARSGAGVSSGPRPGLAPAPPSSPVAGGGVTCRAWNMAREMEMTQRPKPTSDYLMQLKNDKKLVSSLPNFCGIFNRLERLLDQGAETEIGSICDLPMSQDKLAAELEQDTRFSSLFHFVACLHKGNWREKPGIFPYARKLLLLPQVVKK
ncbi:uncharacterized protein [Chlorocebus sabaeus]|uniref:uncharacterized protein n=1 Tax=Chlorocebus sabaeus TaxID=60711 RepID=UPI003BF968FE